MSEQRIREDMVTETIRLIFKAGLHPEQRARIAFTHMALRTDDQIHQDDTIPTAEVPVAWWRKQVAS